MSRCAVCGSSDTGFLAEKQSYRFSQCRHCDFIFLDPMPAQEDLNNQYQQRDAEPEPVCDKAGSRMRRAWIKLPRFLPYAAGKKVLDLGCGGGFVAQTLSLIADTATGIDISENAIRYARSRFSRPEFLCQSFTELLQSPRSYDFIYSSEVIEHVSDVNLYMRVLQHLSAPGAYIYITTPDAGHPGVPVKISEWDVFTPPVHVQFFNRRNAALLFERYGFRIRKFYTNRKPGLIFLAQKT